MMFRSFDRAVSIPLLVVLVAVAGPMAHGDPYKVDASHTAVIFKIKHLEMSYTVGRFNHAEGNFTTGTSPSFEFTIKTDSVDTNDTKRDEHLRSPDFFNAKQFPVITFKSTSVEADGDNFNVTGDLTLHGVIKPINVTLEQMGEGKDPWGNYRVGFTTKFTINRSEYGMANMLDMVGDEVKLMVSFEGIRQ